MTSDSSLLPAITVVIATVHRPEDIIRAVASTLESTRDRFRVIVVDQGGGSETRNGLQAYEGDARVRYLAMPRRGLSAALNHGADAADADLIAITGDDCIVRADRLERVTDAFARDPRIAVVFGRVTSAPFDAARGFVPGCAIECEFLAREVGDLHRMTGTTACMAVRKSVWRELGGFDEALGVGAPLRSGEDLDLALRALQAGYTVLQTPDVEVEHQTPVLVGAVGRHPPQLVLAGGDMAKSLKLAGGPMALGLAKLVRRWVSGGSEVAVTYGVRPDRVAMLLGFVTGFWRDLVEPVDRRGGTFKRSSRLRN